MKVRIQTETKLTYMDTIEVEQPENMTDQDFDNLLARIEKDRMIESAEDLAGDLNRNGVKVLKHTSSFPDSPDDCEIEIVDVCNIK